MELIGIAESLGRVLIPYLGLNKFSMLLLFLFLVVVEGVAKKNFCVGYSYVSSSLKDDGNVGKYFIFY